MTSVLLLEHMHVSACAHSVGERAMARQVLVVFVALSLQLLAANAADTAANARPGCLDQCGNVNVPYPFGFGKDGQGNDCFRQSEFSIICDKSTTPAKPYLDNSKKVEVTNMSVVSGEISILAKMAVDCHSYVALKSKLGGIIIYEPINDWTDLSQLPFTFSSTRNKFTAIGCDTVAFLGGKPGVLYAVGCLSYCETTKGMENGTCSGQGCCETPVPRGVGMYNISIRSFDDQGQSRRKNRCGNAFVVENGKYEFHVPDLYDESFRERRFPVVLDWSMGNMSCGPEVEQSGNYACRSKNSECVNSTRGVGYVCNCSKGYEGNPYLENGCQDINECEHPDIYPCNGRCKNTLGGYECKTGRIQLFLGVGIGIFFLLLICFLAIWGLQRRNLLKLKQVIHTYEGSIFRLYSEQELKRAIEKVSPNERVLSEDSQGTVYKGVLEGNKAVSIKKFKMFDDRRSKELVKEVITLSQINHKNVIMLLGCCLGVEQPMLVYEFIPGGSLSSFLHERDCRDPISLDTRLSIAVGVADALTCLHAYDPTPILHGDIKSTNILLDEFKTAKLSDFTASRLALKDKKQRATMVQGTIGYLDPEYFQTNQLTEKSDVYSFGVVLVELVTGKDPLAFEGPEEQSLALHFLSSVMQHRLMVILDEEIVREGDMERVYSIAELACQCLKVKGDDRPAMEDVLKALRSIGRVPRQDVGSQ